MDWFFDIEVYKNYSCVTFLADEVDECVFFDHRNFSDLEEFLSTRVTALIGFNNLRYDNIILQEMVNCAFLPEGELLQWLWEKSRSLIGQEDRNLGKLSSHLRVGSAQIRCVDLMTIMRYDHKGISLKECAVKLQYHTVENLPYPFDKLLSEEETSHVRVYNRQDVEVTRLLFSKLKDFVKMRIELSSQLKLDLVNSDDSGIANKILERECLRKFHLNKYELKNEGYNHPSFTLDECLLYDYGQYEELRPVIWQLTGRTHQQPLDIKITIDNVRYVIGLGGLHSENCWDKYESTDDLMIMDCDVASFYPNLITTLDICPRQIPSFDFYKSLINRRLEAKRKGNKVLSEGLKITINSIAGKMNAPGYWLYDPKSFLKITLNGQMMLLVLILRLTRAGIRVVSANTDGIVSVVRVDQMSLYEEICKEWESNYQMTLEFEQYEKLYLRDVNNYLGVKLNKTLKCKGDYVPFNQRPLDRSYDPPIVIDAVVAFLTQKIDFLTTINLSSSIYEFLILRKAGGQFQIRRVNSEREEVLQKINRFYVSTSGDVLIREDRLDKSRSSRIFAGHTVRVANRISDTKLPPDLHVNWYVRECEKLVEGFQVRKLF